MCISPQLNLSPWVQFPQFNVLWFQPDKKRHWRGGNFWCICLQKVLFLWFWSPEKHHLHGGLSSYVANSLIMLAIEQRVLVSAATRDLYKQNSFRCFDFWALTRYMHLSGSLYYSSYICLAYSLAGPHSLQCNLVLFLTMIIKENAHKILNRYYRIPLNSSDVSFWGMCLWGLVQIFLIWFKSLNTWNFECFYPHQFYLKHERDLSNLIALYLIFCALKMYFLMKARTMHPK